MQVVGTAQSRNSKTGNVPYEYQVPHDNLGAALEVLQKARGRKLEMESVDERTARLKYDAPWANVVDGLSETLAHATQGYASLAVSRAPSYRKADLVKVDVAINGEIVDALSFVAIRAEAEQRGRAVSLRLRGHVPRQQFEIIIQARVGLKVVARERIAPLRKDVLTTKSGTPASQLSRSIDLSMSTFGVGEWS